MTRPLPEIVDCEWLLASLDRLQAAFLANRIEEMMASFSLPLPVYSAAGVSLVRDSDEFLRLVWAFRKAQDRTASSRSTLQSIEPVENGRFRAVIQWHHYSAKGAPVAESLIRYFFHLPRPDAFEIEMMEYLVMPIALSDAEAIIH